jgi:phosphate transport system substrate-binding protein
MVPAHCLSFRKKMIRSFCNLLVVTCLLAGCNTSSSPAKTPIRIDGSNGVRPLILAVVDAYQVKYPNRKIIVGDGMSSSDRIPALQSDSIQVIMASHGLDVPRLEMDGYEVYRFAQMPVVMAVHQSVSVDSLDGATLCSIYAGRLRNWSELGGMNLPIMPLARPIAEVDMEVLMERVPCFGVIRPDSNVVTHESSGDLARALARTEGGIGMTTLTRVSQSEGAIRALAFNGQEPSVANMESGAYNLLRDAFLVVSPDASPEVNHFLEFVAGEGAKVLREEGALPLKR